MSRKVINGQSTFLVPGKRMQDVGHRVFVLHQNNFNGGDAAGNQLSQGFAIHVQLAAQDSEMVLDEGLLNVAIKALGAVIGEQ